ncbi:MAG: hypothetical protein F4X22_06665 [Gemmatimonadales bacterium]|nr:hypothetical protein [Candidatus Palauibacter denitrificans]
MTNIFAAFLLVSGGALGTGATPGAGGGAGPPSPLKCDPRVGGDSGMPETVVVIDHQPLDMDPSEWNHADHDIRWVEVVCWSWVEEYYGVQVRNGAIYVLTDEGLELTREGQIASLEALMAAQDRHLRTHAVYARSLDGLTGVGGPSDYNLPEYFQIHLEETADGWGARVEPTERWLAGFRGSVLAPPCYVFVGTPPDDWDPIPAADRRALTERQPLCIDPFHRDEAESDGS